MNSGTSRSSPWTSILIVSGAFLCGLSTGLVLPRIGRLRRRRRSSSISKKPTDDPQNTHVVRAGAGTGIRVDKERLTVFLTDILEAAGCKPRRHAELVAKGLVFADLRGIPSHGTNRCDAYVNEIAAGLVNGDNVIPSIIQKDGCCATIDGKNGLGAVTSQFAMTVALELAKEFGCAVVTCRNSNHYGCAGYWAQMALEQNCIGLSFTNTSPIAVPTRGKKRAIGTNPISFFAPAVAPQKNTQPVVGDKPLLRDSFQLDMATTVVPIGKVEVMHRIGKSVPRGWGLNRFGEDDCTDASEIVKHGGLYPLGGSEITAGYKGYGLGVMVEILCSILSGADIASGVGPNISAWTLQRKGPVGYSHCFIVIDPSRFAKGSKADDGSFQERLGQYLALLRQQESAGTEKDALSKSVLVAGDPEKEYEKDASTNGGVLLHEPVAVTLKALAARIKLPANRIPRELLQLKDQRDGLTGTTTHVRRSLYE